MAIFNGFNRRVFLVLSMGEFNSKTIVLRCVRTNPNSGRKIPVSFFTKLWFPSSSKCWSTSRWSRDWEFNGSFYMVDFIQLFSGIVPRNGSRHHWALFVIEICSEDGDYEGRIFWKRRENSSLMVIALQMIKFDLYTMKMLHYLSDLILTLWV